VKGRVSGLILLEVLVELLICRESLRLLFLNRATPVFKEIWGLQGRLIWTSRPAAQKLGEFVWSAFSDRKVSS
jgi:hypothetical protein